MPLAAPAAWAADGEAPTPLPEGGPHRLGAPDRARDYVPGELLVKYARGTISAERADVRTDAGVALERRLEVPRWERVAVRDGDSVATTLRELRADPDVVAVERNWILTTFAVPNDPAFGQLWGLANGGQAIEGVAGTPGVDSNAIAAWDVTTGSPAVRVAVVDSGVAYDHPDLAPNIAPGGFDFTDDDSEPFDLGVSGHGTHVAGTIGARGNDGYGVAGMNWQVGIVPVRVMQPSGATDSGPLDRIASGLAYAGQQAPIVNASLGGEAGEQILGDAIRSNPNTLYVVAAGNDGGDVDGDTPAFPCKVAEPNVICVANIDNRGQLSPSSNFGAASVDIAAPGTSIYSDKPAVGPPLFADNADAGDSALKWVTFGGTWFITAENAASAPNSLTDSAGGNYSSGVDKALANAGQLALGAQTGCRLTAKLDIGLGANDFVYVDVIQGNDYSGYLDTVDKFPPFDSWAGGGTSGFVDYETTMNAVDGLDGIKFAFALVDEFPASTGDGVHIDDVEFRCLVHSFDGSPDEWQHLDGTSMASPHVAGAAALLLAHRPGTPVAALRDALLGSATPMASLQGRVATGGRLNARAALDRLTALTAPPPPPPPPPPAKPPFARAKIVTKQAKMKRGRVRIALRCNARGAKACRGRLTLGKRASAGKRDFSVPVGRKRTVTVKLSRSAKRAVRRNGRLRVKAVARTRKVGDRSRSHSRRVLVKRP
ncbi:MAG TPA: S8 family serine peptidase [Solirubrobacteraceae bacterium]|nr:S8 family serine peptidase [Solirubrobacteraceae bacterium]